MLSVVKMGGKRKYILIFYSCIIIVYYKYVPLQ